MFFYNLRMKVFIETINDIILYLDRRLGNFYLWCT